MKFRTLTTKEKDKMIVAFLKSQETDLYLAEINRERYVKLLDEKNISKDLREKTEKLLISSEESIKNTKAILKATESQIPSEERIKKALKELDKPEK
jgi:hypothetical protein